MIKLYIPMLAIFLFVSCSGNSREQLDKRVAANAIIEKNKQTALANEAAEVTQAIQKLEKQGRDMESFRQAADAESRRQCNTVMDDRQQQVKILEEKIKKFPNPFNSQLTPIISDLNACVSCSKNALASCIKTRASVNKAIEDLYPR